MDGGGTRGLATLVSLQAIERTCGQPIHALFDIICGTSTGGILAVALGVLKRPLREVEQMYVFIVHVGGTRCVTSSTDNILKIHSRITWTVEFIRTCIFIFLFYV